MCILHAHVTAAMSKNDEEGIMRCASERWWVSLQGEQGAESFASSRLQFSRKTRLADTQLCVMSYSSN